MCWGRALYGNFLYLLLNYVVKLKLLQKIKSILKYINIIKKAPNNRYGITIFIKNNIHKCILVARTNVKGCTSK